MALTKVDKSLLETTSGTASASTFLRGDGTWNAPASGGFSSVQVFTASGTWTRPAGITKVVIEVQGGGGGGALGPSGYSTWQQCGSAGGYAKKFIDVSSISTSTITVGAFGAGKLAPAGDAGGDGGDSSWVDGTNTVTGVKGVGSYGNYTIATGGAATGGDINIKGGDGVGGQYTKAGSSPLGDGGHSGWNTEPVSTAGSGYGSGGGANYIGSASSGAPGVVIVWEYQ